MRNPALPRRDRPSSYTDAARLDSTKRHFTAAETRAAQRAVGEVLAGRGEPLGRGHFGVVFLVHLDGRPLIVKLGSRRTLHTTSPAAMYGWVQMKWAQGGRGLVKAAEELRHEAGIANFLWARGHRVVPQTVYAPYKGRPALVREYGTIPAHLMPREYDALALALARVVEDRVTVQDDLLVARRLDGSLFVADVGVWRTFRPGGAGIYERNRMARDDLERLLVDLSSVEPWGQGGVPSILEERRLRADLAETRARPQKRERSSEWAADLERKAEARLRSAVERRARAGLP